MQSGIIPRIVDTVAGVATKKCWVHNYPVGIYLGTHLVKGIYPHMFVAGYLLGMFNSIEIKHARNSTFGKLDSPGCF